MEKSVVKRVTGNGTFQSAYGLLYKWEIEMENGQIGYANTKAQNQSTWAVGKETYYTIEEKNGFKNFKHQQAPPETQNTTPSNPGFQKDPTTQRMIISQSSLGHAIEFHKGADGVIKADHAEITATAKIFFDWVISNSQA